MKTMLMAFADFERRDARIQLRTSAGFLAGKIKGGNKEVMLFELEPRPGSYVPRKKMVNVVVAQIVTFEELAPLS